MDTRARAEQPPASLSRRLAELMPDDERRLRRRLDGARKLADPAKKQDALAEIVAAVELAEQRVAARAATVPTLRYPEELPVSQRRDELLAAIRDHQVVIVAGETGSGKTTQLPKICLELGRGIRGMIGHTQPRRIAARTVAARIAEELATPLGETVGYQVRFTDRCSDRTLVKVMTDGILLTELQRDRRLSRYDTIIVDEAHERSLNIDFILGYLKRLVRQRRDLKVIITSATIDPERFSQHFDGAPIVEVSGRTYPVEIRYRPFGAAVDGEEARDQTDAICEAVTELSGEGRGDILVFLSGEREIRDTADALAKAKFANTEILPLYARLSTAEQHRVFKPHPGRRVVLATNVAETSLTVPGVRYVIDPGMARISRYSNRLKVQRLPIEPISRASANQRAGRCGRVAAGICVRLYSEEDFAARSEFTDPEILRTNLASVILQMTALDLGDLAAFGFIDPPDQRNIADGVRLLEELGALRPDESDPRRRLTELGQRLVRLPIDPRLARMVVEADRNGCLEEIIIIAAALSIVDPRERPSDHQQAADQSHARFADPNSDFLAYLNLWRYLQRQQVELSSSGFRRLCGREFLNYLRVREWQDLHGQLRQVAKGLGFTIAPHTVVNPDEPPKVDSQRIHSSLLAGLLSHLGMKDGSKQEYLGARGGRFAIFPGSGLFKKPPRWVVAAELVETSRLWARIAARVEPEWVEPLAKHLVKRQYSEPHWDAGRGAVMAFERVTLYGIPLVTRRAVNFDRVDPKLCRELFIQCALVEGDWDTHHKFFQDNQALLAEVAGLEERTRRRNIVAEDQVRFDFFDQRIPADVVSARHFDAWWKTTRRTSPELLTFDRAILVNDNAGEVSPAQYPDAFHPEGLRQPLPLIYRFEPGTPGDGVTVRVPLALLGQVTSDSLGWPVPGQREELVTALLRSLPKELRKNFVPIPDVARAIVPRLTGAKGSMLAALERELHTATGVVVPRRAWKLDRIPEYLKPTYQVVGAADQPLAEGKDLDAIQRRFRDQARQALAGAVGGLEQVGIGSWTVGTVPRRVEQARDGFAATGYPALVDESGRVALRVLESEHAQRMAMWSGIRRLLLLTVPSPVKLVNARLSNQAKLALSRNPHGSAAALLDDCLSCAVDHLMAQHGGLVWDETGFSQLRDAVRADLHQTLLNTVERVRTVLAESHQVRQSLERTPMVSPGVADLRSQLDELVYPGFVTAVGWSRLSDFPRYLRAAGSRLERLARDPRWDAERLATIERVKLEYQELAAKIPKGHPGEATMVELRWMIEELRVGLFAQALGTAYPISEQRVYRAMDVLENDLASHPGW
jgi:ATP-dependent helicase HrpA